MAIYTVFDEESESEVEKCTVLEPGGKKTEKLNFKFSKFEGLIS